MHGHVSLLEMFLQKACRLLLRRMSLYRLNRTSREPVTVYLAFGINAINHMIHFISDQKASKQVTKKMSLHQERRLRQKELCSK